MPQRDRQHRVDRRLPFTQHDLEERAPCPGENYTFYSKCHEDPSHLLGVFVTYEPDRGVLVLSCVVCETVMCRIEVAE